MELLAIIAAFKHWHHYLKGACHTITVLTDHANLTPFMNIKELTRRQACWAQRLSAYDFTIEYCAGSKNPADGLSRRPDYAPAPAEMADYNSAILHLLQRQISPAPNSEMEWPRGSHAGSQNFTLLVTSYAGMDGLEHLIPLPS